MLLFEKTGRGLSSISPPTMASGKQLISESPSVNLKQGDSDWTQLTVSATAPTNAAFVEIDLGSYNNRGTVWFDDVTFE